MVDPYATHLEKDGKQLKKFHLMFIEEDPRLCDSCDKKKVCGSVSDLVGNVHILCKECLQSYADEFDKPDEEEDVEEVLGDGMCDHCKQFTYKGKYVKSKWTCPNCR